MTNGPKKYQKLVKNKSTQQNVCHKQKRIKRRFNKPNSITSCYAISVKELGDILNQNTLRNI